MGFAGLGSGLGGSPLCLCFFSLAPQAFELARCCGLVRVWLGLRVRVGVVGSGSWGRVRVGVGVR